MENALRPLVTIVAPCYNEAPVLELFFARLETAVATETNYAFEFVFIDDGSTDATPIILDRLAGTDNRVRVITLSRNFGHQMAIMAGLDLCSGDFVVIIDADLQDPPEAIHGILERLAQGFDLVHMVRIDRTVDPAWKRIGATWFYRLMRICISPSLPHDAAEFKGFNRAILESVVRYRESKPFLRGIFASLGFNQTELAYVREPRAAGHSKYPISKLVDLVANGIVSMSLLPVRLIFFSGLLMWLLLFLFLAGATVRYTMGSPVDGVVVWLTSVIASATGFLLLALGIVGEYAARALQELKGRPLYLIRSVRNFPGDMANRDRLAQSSRVC